jgi:hypothetical protein
VYEPFVLKVKFSKDDLSQLYARRWHVELDLRNLKTTTGMDVLSCQTPQMNEKQLWVHLLAYNLIRLLMVSWCRPLAPPTLNRANGASNTRCSCGPSVPGGDFARRTIPSRYSR